MADLMPEDFEGRPEAAIWSVLRSRVTVGPQNAEIAAGYCRARADEDAARRELKKALDANDADAASKYGRIAEAMRTQAIRLYGSLM